MTRDCCDNSSRPSERVTTSCSKIMFLKKRYYCRPLFWLLLLTAIYMFTLVYQIRWMDSLTSTTTKRTTPSLTSSSSSSSSWATTRHNNNGDNNFPESSSTSPSRDTTWSNNTNHNIKNNNNINIRRWGCHRTETPFVFVHIGKAGGGMIRARIAAGALNYTRSDKEWMHPELDQHYYNDYSLIQRKERKDNNKNKNKTTAPVAYFCNSRFKNHRLPNSTKFGKSFEGNLACFAKTPIGMALACPATSFVGEESPRCKGCELDSDQCNLVYVSHNVLGNELQYLPPKYLQNWWLSTYNGMAPSSSAVSALSSEIANALSRLAPGDTRWCSPHYNLSRSKIIQIDHVNSKYTKCSETLSPKMDLLFSKWWDRYQQQQQLQQERRQERSNADNLPSNYSSSTTPSLSVFADDNNYDYDYASIYASMPLHRTTVLRDPFSWLHSKFVWHKHYRKHKCDDIQSAVNEKTGWADDFCVEYILYLCGDDCVHRYDHLHTMNNGMMNHNDMLSSFLKQIERQAETNLRQSFSVVGLWNETDVFLNMITARISYINTSLNPSVTGTRHASQRTIESMRCSKIYQENVTFREEFKKNLPSLAALDRLFRVGVQVNRFQRNELNQCSAGVEI